VDVLGQEFLTSDQLSTGAVLEPGWGGGRGVW
jgi:hypothetical protein